MKIDSITGIVEFEGSHSVGPDLRRDIFLASPLGRRVRPIVTNKEWISYFAKVKDDRDEFALTVVFRGDQIVEVRLAKTGFNDSWAHWSEDKELQRKTEHDRLLSRMLGQASGHFPWGEIASNFDLRSGASQIIIRYNAGDE